MTERVVLFGPGSELTGILTQPDHAAVTTEKPACLLMNAGFLHRTGFNRFNTDFARMIAEKGHASLRFDLHGLGDSAKYDGKKQYDDQALLDIQGAINFLLESTGAAKCIIVGLCSGADYAHPAALQDQRVAGIVLLDGYAYRTLGFYIHDYGPGLINPKKAFRFLGKKWFSLIKTLKRTESSGIALNKPAEIYVRDFPKKKKIVREIQQLIDRGAELYYIYSGGVPIYYNYANQFRHMFRSVHFKDKVCFKYIKEADHIYTVNSVRNKLMTLVSEWMEERFDVPPGGV